jgi:D-cysteine desulfhydrase
LTEKADVLITCGGVQSNHARATTAVAARHGLGSVLFLKGNVPDSSEGNLWLNQFLGARILHITEDEYTRVDEMMEAEAERLRSEGSRPYVIPEGASNCLGAMGYVKAAEEIRNQLDAASLVVDRIVFACGSGGTHAGLLIGKKLFGINATLTAINVCKSAGHFVDKVHEICVEADTKLGLGLSFAKNEIDVVDGYVREGYAREDKVIFELIARVARLEGVILDPVYTGKAMYGLLDLVSRGEISSEESILFLHTGGIFSLFAYRSGIPLSGPRG